jgi:hypothetical protein
MGGDARIRWISNNGLEMVRKPVKTAVKRHGGGLEDGESGRSHSTSERATAVEARGPGTIVEGIATFLLSQGSRGLYKCFLEEALEYHRGARSLFWIDLAIGT